MNKFTGLGEQQAVFNVHLANKPPIASYENRRSIKACTRGEIKTIGELAGNHWRKIFNVYSKLLYALDLPQWQEYETWQTLRDNGLLQKGSDTALIWNTAEARFTEALKAKPNKDRLTLVTGKSYAEALGLSEKLVWIDQDFALLKSSNLIVSPYFDYRQLSDVKIQKLAELIKNIKII